MSLLNAVKCYPCREVPLNYNWSPLFHGGDTGSTPVRDAKHLSIFEIHVDVSRLTRFLVDSCGRNRSGYFGRNVLTTYHCGRICRLARYRGLAGGLVALLSCRYSFVVLPGSLLHQKCPIHCQIVSHAHPIALLPHPDAKHELPNTSALHMFVPTQLIPAPPHHPNVQLAQARMRADPP